MPQKIRLRRSVYLLRERCVAISSSNSRSDTLMRSQSLDISLNGSSISNGLLSASVRGHCEIEGGFSAGKWFTSGFTSGGWSIAFFAVFSWGFESLFAHSKGKASIGQKTTNSDKARVFLGFFRLSPQSLRDSNCQLPCDLSYQPSRPDALIPSPELASGEAATDSYHAGCANRSSQFLASLA